MTDPAATPANKAFLSYSHGGNSRLAPALHQALERFGKRWYHRRVFLVFLDEEHLVTGRSLRDQVLEELQRSEFFILVASARAAGRPWVREEIAHWLTHRPDATRNLLVALAADDIVWDESRADFDWTKTTALPRDLLQGRFPSEPVWADFRWAATESQLSLAHPRFRDEVRKLAAPLHHCQPYELDERHRREQQRARTFRFGLWFFLALALIASGLAYRERQLSIARALAANAEAMLASDPALGVFIASNATRVSRRVGGPFPDVLRRALFDSSLEGIVTRPTAGFGFDRLATSPDGAWLAAASGDRVLRRWALHAADARLHLLDERILATNRSLRHLEFSPSGALLAAVDATRILVWDAASALPLSPFDLHSNAVPALAFHPRDDLIASADGRGSLFLWRPREGTVVARLDLLPSPPSRLAGAAEMALSPDGRLLACRPHSTNVFLIGIHTSGLSVQQTLHPPSPVVRLAFVESPPGTARLVTACRDGAILVWDALTATIVSSIPGHTSAPDVLHVDPLSGRWLTAERRAAVAHLHSPPSSPESKTLTFTLSPTTTPVGFHLGGEVLLVHRDFEAEVWSPLNPRQPLLNLRGHRSTIRHVAVVPGLGHVLTTSGALAEANPDLDNTLRLWKLRSPRPVLPALGPLPWPPSPGFSPATGRLLAVARPHVLLGSLDAPGPPQALPAPAEPAQAISLAALAPSGAHAAVAYSRARPATDFIEVLDLETRRRITTYRGHGRNLILTLLLSRDGSRGVSSDHTGAIHLWDTSPAPRALVMTNAPADDIPLQALSPDDRFLFATGRNGVHRVFRLGDPQPRATLDLGLAVTAAAFHPGEPVVALGCQDKLVRLWDFRRNRITRHLAGHTRLLRSIVFSARGDFLVTSSDRTTRLWTADTGYSFGIVPSYTPEALGAWFTADGLGILILGDDGVLRQVDCPECCPDAELLRLARSRSSSRPVSAVERRLYFRE